MTLNVLHACGRRQKGLNAVSDTFLERTGPVRDQPKTVRIARGALPFGQPFGLKPLVDRDNLNR